MSKTAEVRAWEEMLTIPEPGYISLAAPPYTDSATTLLADNSIATLWEWLDQNHLAYGSLDDSGNLGTAIITLDGQVTEISANFALAVLR